MINAVKKVVKLVKTITDSEIFIDDTNDIMQKIKIQNRLNEFIAKRLFN